MTGTERLRALAGAWDEWGLGGTLTEMADEIERERACDADTIENVRLIVGGVIDEMERHILGHEGMEDSPVARWARELREALGGKGNDPTDDVSMSAYDLLPKEEREAVAWVREHGGLEKIIKQRRDSVPRAAYERKLDKRLRHIAECEEALRRRNATISSLEKAADRSRKQIADMRPRLMPEGMEWPRYEDGEPVRIGDEYECWCGETHRLNSVTIKKYNSIINLTEPHPFVASDGPLTSHGKLVKRPAPKVLDADGAEIRADKIEHRPEGFWALELFADGSKRHSAPVSILTHERPDSWERLEEDAGCTATKYNERRGTIFTTKQQVARDLVRRARALAGGA